jgi:hypothetical protein
MPSCVFCGEPKVTREHAWPQWVKRGLPNPPKCVVHTRRGATIKEAKREGPSFDLIVRRVCRSCNSGWMARLEDDARPLLAPLILGRGRALHAAGQELVSRWALKTAMMLEFSHPNGLAIPATDRHRLYESGRLPDYCQVWIGLYGGRRLNTFYFHDRIRWPASDGSTRATAYAVTFGIGHLMFHLWVPDHPGWETEYLSPLSSRLHQVSPYVGSVTVGRPLVEDSHLEIAVYGQRNTVGRAQARRLNLLRPRVY